MPQPRYLRMKEIRTYSVAHAERPHYGTSLDGKPSSEPRSKQFTDFLWKILSLWRFTAWDARRIIFNVLIGECL